MMKSKKRLILIGIILLGIVITNLRTEQWESGINKLLTEKIEVLPIINSNGNFIS